jgi:PDZ domain-containing protein
VVALVLVAAAFIHVPYVIIRPGDATALDAKVLQVKGAPVYDHTGELLYLTVSVSNRDPNLYRWLFAKLDSNASVDRREEVIGCADYTASQRLAVEEMDQSQDVAKTVALRHLGYTVPDRPSRVVLGDVVCGSPADGKLELGDVVVAIDGQAVAKAEDVRPLVTTHQPGDEVVFTVERDGTRRDVRFPLGKRQGAAFAGISPQTDTRHDIPVDVSIDTQRVSGPSAGLAFSLAIIDDLTKGNLTGGGDVAVTGTISEDGSVGPVGGVEQKAVTAQRAGARLMLVPRAEAKLARAHAGKMKVVSVDTLDDALRALERAGGSGIAGAAPTAQ